MSKTHEMEIETLRAQLVEWKGGIASETKFWDWWMEEQGGQWPEDFRKRFDTEALLDPWIATAIRKLGRDRVSILDVGSGPVPVIGYNLGGVALRIMAVDPLASIYKKLLARHGLRPPVAPTFALAEELSTFFEPDSFDLIHCRNALDHSFDRLRGIGQMLKLVDIGGFILLRHHRNEAENEEYKGFHRYNFDCSDNRFVIWNRSMRADIGDFLAGQAQVSCTTQDFLDVTIRKVAKLGVTSEPRNDRLAQYLEAFIQALGD